MKRIIIASLLGLALSACALFQGVQNPLNTNRLAAAESAYGIALSAAVAYRSLPLCKAGTNATLANVCARRDVVIKMQAADKIAQVSLKTASQFVRANPTLDATSLISAVESAVSAFREIQAKEGVH